LSLTAADGGGPGWGAPPPSLKTGLLELQQGQKIKKWGVGKLRKRKIE